MGHFVYEQSTGRMYDPNRMLLAIGYAGFGDGKNNPLFETVRDMGPIPVGTYTLMEPADTVEHGPYAIVLIPDAANEMHGRSGFMIHGDNIHVIGSASRGCIILARFAREYMWRDPDHTLNVVAAIA